MLGYPIAQFVRLLLVTGQRLEEVTGAEWREIESLRVFTEGDGRRVDADEAFWTIPEERMKGKIAQEVPWLSLTNEPTRAGNAARVRLRTRHLTCSVRSIAIFCNSACLRCVRSVPLRCSTIVRTFALIGSFRP